MPLGFPESQDLPSSLALPGVGVSHFCLELCPHPLQCPLHVPAWPMSPECMSELAPLRPGCQPPSPLQVAPQPLWFSDTVANLRKLKELPHHLVHSGRIEELKQEVLGKAPTHCGPQRAGPSPPLCSPLQEPGKG